MSFSFDVERMNMGCLELPDQLQHTKMSELLEVMIELEKGRIKRLRKALDEATNVGIYPLSMKGGPNAYEQRTPYMEGWNDCCRAAIKAIRKELEEGDWVDDDGEEVELPLPKENQ